MSYYNIDIDNVILRINSITACRCNNTGEVAIVPIIALPWNLDNNIAYSYRVINRAYTSTTTQTLGQRV